MKCLLRRRKRHFVTTNICLLQNCGIISGKNSKVKSTGAGITFKNFYYEKSNLNCKYFISIKFYGLPKWK